MPTGTVKWFNAEKGFGFIIPDEGEREVLVRYTGIIGVGFRSLEEDQQVEFDLVRGKHPEAKNVRAL